MALGKLEIDISDSFIFQADFLVKMSSSEHA